MLSVGEGKAPTVSQIKYLEFDAEKLAHPGLKKARRILDRQIKNNEFRTILVRLQKAGIGKRDLPAIKKVINSYIMTLIKGRHEDALIKLLKLNPDQIKRNLVKVISQIKDHRTKAVLTNIAGGLKGAYVLTRLRAIYALGTLGSRKAYPILEEMSEHDYEDNRMDKALSNAMGRINAATRAKYQMRGDKKVAEVIKSKELAFVVVLTNRALRKTEGKIPMNIPVYNITLGLASTGPKTLINLLKLGEKTRDKSGEKRTEIERIRERLLHAIRTTKNFGVREVLKDALRRLDTIYKLIQIYSVQHLGNMGSRAAKSAAPHLLKMVQSEPLLKREMDYVMALEAAKTEKQRQMVKDAYIKLTKTYPDKEKVLLGIEDNVPLVGGLVEDVADSRREARIRAAIKNAVSLTMSKRLIREIAIALSKMESKKAIPFFKALYNENRASAVAIVALGRIGDKRAIPFLKDIIMRGPADSAQLAIGALCYYPKTILKMDKLLKARLITLLDSNNFMTARAAALLLGTVGDVRAAPHLVGILRSSVEPLPPIDLSITVPPRGFFHRLARRLMDMKDVIPMEDRRLQKFKPLVSKLIKEDMTLFYERRPLQRIIFGDTVDPRLDRLATLYPSRKERMPTGVYPMTKIPRGKGVDAETAAIITGRPVKETGKAVVGRHLPRGYDPEQGRIANLILHRMASVLESMRSSDLTEKDFQNVVIELGKRKHPMVSKLLQSVCFNKNIPLSARKLAIATMGKTGDPSNIPTLKRMIFFADSPELQTAALGALSKFSNVWRSASKSFMDKLARFMRSKNLVLKRAATLLLAREGDRRAVPELILMMATHGAMVKIPKTDLFTLDPSLKGEKDSLAKSIYRNTAGGELIAGEYLKKTKAEYVEQALVELAARLPKLKNRIVQAVKKVKPTIAQK